MDSILNHMEDKNGRNFRKSSSSFAILQLDTILSSVLTPRLRAEEEGMRNPKMHNETAWEGSSAA